MQFPTMQKVMRFETLSDFRHAKVGPVDLIPNVSKRYVLRVLVAQPSNRDHYTGKYLLRQVVIKLHAKLRQGKSYAI